MDLTQLKSLIPDHAKDLKLNLSTVLTPEGAPGLTATQIAATALASAIASRNPTLLREIEVLGRAASSTRRKSPPRARRRRSWA